MKKMRPLNKQMLIDKIDEKIIRELANNSRLSFRQIATNLNLSPGTVLKRIKTIEKQGIIKGYTTILDHEKLGYELTVIVELTVSKGKLLEVERKIAKIPNVCGVYDVTGLTDCIVIAKFKKRSDLSNFAKSLLAMDYVERTNTHVVLNVIKEDSREIL